MGSVSLFVCKQKTAYEMRISDWSSDVCSSDLVIDRRLPRSHHHGDDWIDHLRIRRESLRCPFACDRLRRQVGIPGEAAEGVPVRLVEDRSADRKSGV